MSNFHARHLHARQALSLAVAAGLAFISIPTPVVAVSAPAVAEPCPLAVEAFENEGGGGVHTITISGSKAVAKLPMNGKLRPAQKALLDALRADGRPEVVVTYSPAVLATAKALASRKLVAYEVQDKNAETGIKSILFKLDAHAIAA